MIEGLKLKQDWYWVKPQDCELHQDALIYYQEVYDKGRVKTYGFNYNMSWTDIFFVYPEDAFSIIKKATNEEVLAYLSLEAIGRGFVEGCVFSYDNKYYTIKDTNYQFKKNKLIVKDVDIECVEVPIFDNGKWSEISNIYTREEAENKFKIIIID